MIAVLDERGAGGGTLVYASPRVCVAPATPGIPEPPPTHTRVMVRVRARVRARVRVRVSKEVNVSRAHFTIS